MNAGTKEGSINNIIREVSYYDINQRAIGSLDNKAIDFEYRNSLFQKNKEKIVLSVLIELGKDSPNDSKANERIKNEKMVSSTSELP